MMVPCRSASSKPGLAPGPTTEPPDPTCSFLALVGFRQGYAAAMSLLA